MAIGIPLFIASLTLHLAMLRLAKRVSPPGLAPTGLRLTGGSLLVLISHMLVAIVFAVGFAWAASLGLGGLDKEPAMAARDYNYFALITVTTVGLGDRSEEHELQSLMRTSYDSCGLKKTTNT